MDIHSLIDRIQAGTALVTCAVSFVSMVLVAIYTFLTKKTLDAALKSLEVMQSTLDVTRHAAEEGLRPVVLLKSTHYRNDVRWGTFINSGNGIAVDLLLCGLNGDSLIIDSNVLPPDGEMDVRIPLAEEYGVLDMAYSSIKRHKSRTISSFAFSALALNKHLPDYESTNEADIQNMRRDMYDRAIYTALSIRRNERNSDF